MPLLAQVSRLQALFESHQLRAGPVLQAPNGLRHSGLVTHAPSLAHPTPRRRGVPAQPPRQRVLLWRSLAALRRIGLSQPNQRPPHPREALGLGFPVFHPSPRRPTSQAARVATRQGRIGGAALLGGKPLVKTPLWRVKTPSWAAVLLCQGSRGHPGACPVRGIHVFGMLHVFFLNAAPPGIFILPSSDTPCAGLWRCCPGPRSDQAPPTSSGGIGWRATFV
jgi:hypothetical protein